MWVKTPVLEPLELKILLFLLITHLHARTHKQLIDFITNFIVAELENSIEKHRPIWKKKKLATNNYHNQRKLE
jgi:hypothetical protein